ncbi:MAG: hypothetical protein COA92_04165 [Sulfurovum sp.]|nr:MAG: hypothetical protein COA92_04165 [Sulfurovum sp.]
MNRTQLSRRLIVEALLRGDSDVTALNGMKFLTTRITNHIVELRKMELDIETKIIKTKNSSYGAYYLKGREENISRAYEILEALQDDEVA